MIAEHVRLARVCKAAPFNHLAMHSMTPAKVTHPPRLLNSIVVYHTSALPVPSKQMSTVIVVSFVFLFFFACVRRAVQSKEERTPPRKGTERRTSFCFRKITEDTMGGGVVHDRPFSQRRLRGLVPPKKTKQKNIATDAGSRVCSSCVMPRVKHDCKAPAEQSQNALWQRSDTSA